MPPRGKRGVPEGLGGFGVPGEMAVCEAKSAVAI
jgi:hypothetical protein